MMVRGPTMNHVRSLLAITLGAAALLGAWPARAFGLECWLGGERYHYNIAKTALSDRSVAFSPDAIHLVGWNDDSLDYYSKHPAIDVFNYMTRDWMKLHFDDLYSAKQIAAQW